MGYLMRASQGGAACLAQPDRLKTAAKVRHGWIIRANTIRIQKPSYVRLNPVSLSGANSPGIRPISVTKPSFC